ncbi:MAG: hypothetical protein ACYSTL_00235 [Planctomycetota bacterium]|jgi:hypothetical protein
MNHRRHHWLEKFRVQLATAGVLAAAYFGLWALLRGADAQSPLTFLGADGYGRLLRLGIAFWVACVFCAAVTVSNRPEGALIAVLIGFGGLAIRSVRIRSLLWSNMDSLGGVYHVLILEVLLLGCVLVAGWFVITFVQTLIAKVFPGFTWRGPRAGLTKPEIEQFISAGFARRWVFTTLVGLDGYYYARSPDDKAPSPSDVKMMSLPTEPGALKQFLSSLVLQLIVVAVLILLLARSAERGQILFALVASFFLAGLLANQLFPSPYAVAGWVLPIVLGICFYALAAMTAIGKPPQGWIEVSYYARALPIDWLTAGCGGAVLGSWVSARIHEMHRIEHLEEKEPEPA